MAAQAGTFCFKAKDDGQTFRIDTYIPDATGTSLCFSNIGLSGSSSTPYWTAPEDCELVDVSGAAPTAVGFTLTFNGAPVPNATFRWANQLATLATRMKTRIFIPAGTQVSGLQY